MTNKNSNSHFVNAIAKDFEDDQGNWSLSDYTDAAKRLFGRSMFFGETAENIFLELGYKLISDKNRSSINDFLDNLFPGLKDSISLFIKDNSLVAQGILTVSELNKFQAQYPHIDTSNIKVVMDSEPEKNSGNVISDIISNIFEEKEVPEAVDLREFCSPVGNQKQTARCAAFSIVHCAEMIANMRGDNYPRLAPSFAMLQFLKEQGDEYTFEEAHSGGRGTVGGITPSKILQRTGVARQELWEDDDVEPKVSLEELEKDALNYKLQATPVPIKLDDVKGALSHGYPVILNMAVGPEFSKVGRDGIIKEPSSGKWKHGRHSMHIVGYRGNFFIVKNSWGDWGDAGYCYMSKSVIVQSQPDLIMLGFDKSK